ncbi:MBL fold metallo-hydrolase [bacterium]|nr:MBL fold metallo-hydrolase [bacterium]
MRFGDYDCYPLDFGEFLVDGGIMFGIIPKIEWEQSVSADEKNRILLKSRSLLIQGNGKNILVDTGYGSKLSDEIRDLHGVQSNPLDINLLLSGFELDCHQITDVILSHLHFEHAGGATKTFSNKVESTFPNAQYYVQNEQWEYACNPHERDKNNYISDDFLPLNSSRQLQFLEGSVPLFDGIEVMVTYGHTPAQQHVLVKGDDQSLFFCADMIPTTDHIPIAYQASNDNRPLDHFPEKDYFLRKAIRENWVLFFQHDPKIVAATVKNGPKWVEFDREVVL